MHKIVPLISKVNLAEATDNLILRLSFYESSLDTETCPVIYSAEKEITASEIVSEESHNFTWVDDELPNLITAYNTVNLATQCSIIVLLWVKIADGRINTEFLIG